MGYRFYISKIKKRDLKLIEGKTIKEIEEMLVGNDHLCNYNFLEEVMNEESLGQVGESVLGTDYDNKETIKHFGEELTKYLQSGYDFKVMSKKNIIDYNINLNNKRIDWLEKIIKDSSQLKGDIARTKMMLEYSDGEPSPYCPDDWSNAIYESYEIYKDYCRNKNNYVYIMYAW